MIKWTQNSCVFLHLAQISETRKRFLWNNKAASIRKVQTNPVYLMVMKEDKNHGKINGKNGGEFYGWL